MNPILENIFFYSVVGLVFITIIYIIYIISDTIIKGQNKEVDMLERNCYVEIPIISNEENKTKTC